MWIRCCTWIWHWRYIWILIRISVALAFPDSLAPFSTFQQTLFTATPVLSSGSLAIVAFLHCCRCYRSGRHCVCVRQDFPKAGKDGRAGSGWVQQTTTKEKYVRTNMDLALFDTNEITGATQIRSNTNLFLVNPIVYDFRFLDPIGYGPNAIQNLN